MGNQDLTPTYDDLVSEMLDALGMGAIPSPADGWAEWGDLAAEGIARGRTEGQVRGSLDRAVKAGRMEKQLIGRRVFYREVK